MLIKSINTNHTIIRATFVRLFVCLFLFSSQVLGPIFMKLGGWIKVDPRSVLEGFIFGKVKVTGVKGQITFSLRVQGPIFMKLGGWIKVDPRSVLEGFIFGKVKVTGVKGQITVFRYG